jgi:hypothetical protein
VGGYEMEMLFTAQRPTKTYTSGEVQVHALRRAGLDILTSSKRKKCCRKCDSAGRNISGVLHHKRTRINSPERFCCMIQAKTQPATKDHQTPLVDECPQYSGHGAKWAWPVIPGLLAYNPTSGDFSSGVSGIAVTPTATPMPFLPRERALKTSTPAAATTPDE